MLCFFNLAGAIHDPDNDGVELSSMGAARREAARHIGQLIYDDPDVVWGGEEVRVEVTDVRRSVLFTIVVLGVDGPPPVTNVFDCRGHASSARPLG